MNNKMIDLHFSQAQNILYAIILASKTKKRRVFMKDSQIGERKMVFTMPVINYS